MGEWSDYFEQFPEENPANYVGDCFDPRGAEAMRARKAKLVEEQARLDAEIASIIEKHSRPKPSDKGRK